MRFFFNHPSVKDHLNVKNWMRSLFLFKSSLKAKDVKSLASINNFNILNNLNINLISLAFNIKNNRFHRNLYPSDIDINPSITTFDYRFWSFDIYNNYYKYINPQRPSYIWGVNNHFISTSFFINSFNSSRILYNELYFKSKNIAYKIDKFLNKTYLLQYKPSYKFYNNLIWLMNSYYYKNYDYTLKDSQQYLSSESNTYGLDQSSRNLSHGFKYAYKPSDIKKSLLVKNYFYKRFIHKYNKKINYQFKRYYYSNHPKIIRNKGIDFINYSNLYVRFVLRSIFYKLSSKFLIYKIKIFLKRFFMIFIQNIRNRLYKPLLNESDNHFYDSIDNMMYVIKRYFYFNKYFKHLKYLLLINKYRKKFKKFSRIVLLNEWKVWRSFKGNNLSWYKWKRIKLNKKLNYRRTFTRKFNRGF